MLNSIPTWFQLLILNFITYLHGQHDMFYDFGKGYTPTQVTSDDTTGNVFVAGTNFLAHLTPNLTIKSFKNWTKLNCSNCSNREPSCCLNGEPNTVIEFDYAKRKLLACGVSNSGACFYYDPSNTSSITELDGNLEASVGQTGPILASFLSRNSSEVVFGISQPQSNNLSFISYRTIQKIGQNQAKMKLLGGHSQLKVYEQFRQSVNIKFIKMFEYNNSIYFLTTKTKNVSETEGYQTAIFRICKRNESVYPFLVVPLTCKKNIDDDDLFNLATSAEISGSGMGKKLLVSFGRSWDPTLGKPDADQGSVVCSFKLQSIEDETNFIKADCDKIGLDGASISDWVFGPFEKCKKQNVSLSTCDNGSKNRAVEGFDDKALEINTQLFLPGLVITSIITYTIENKHYVTLTTDGGQLYKYVNNHTKLVPYERRDAVGTSRIQSDTQLDVSQEYIFILINNQVRRIDIYQCSKHAQCSDCIKSDKHTCVWFENRCVPLKNHENLMYTCPPTILQVVPTTGKVSGGNTLTIIGKGLGSRATSTKNISRNVEVCGKTCHVDKNLSNNTQIVCRLSAVTKEMNCSVSVYINDNSRAEVDYIIAGSYVTGLIFQYKKVVLTDFNPKRGPISGGTQLTITGVHFNMTNNITVHIGNHTACRVYSVKDTEVKCETHKFLPLDLAKGGNEGEATWCDYIVMCLDDTNRTSSQKYCYKPDPTILNIFPRKTIKSGGLKVNVKGTNLDIIAEPKLGFSIDGSDIQPEAENCTAFNSTNMYCATPSVKDIVPGDAPVTGNIYFQMDGVEQLNNFSKYHPQLSQIDVKSDPKVKPFPEKKLSNFDGDLYIDATGLKGVVGVEQIKVLIGNFSCPVTGLDDYRVSCRPNTTSHFQIGTRLPVKIIIGNRDYTGSIYITSTPEVPKVNMVHIIAAVAVVIIMVVIIALVCYCCFRKGQSSTKTSGGLLEMSESCYESQISGVQCVRKLMDSKTILKIEEAKLFIPLDKLTMGDTIGAGNFGCVCDGFLMEDVKDVKDVKKKVAVKTLQDNGLGEINLKDFVEEALIMKDFDHANVLKLLGICLSKESTPLVVLPFMGNGDLLKYVSNEENEELSVERVLMFAIDISRGMEYLASLKFVHRDLAARNCMLDSNFNVKVADFGLTRNIYEKGYYHSDNKKTKLPIRWMAIESLERGTYSSKSDVWSLAVVIWELLTRGVTPYPGVEGWDVINFLRCNRRLSKPYYSDENLYTVMLNCWQTDPNDRPDFKHVIEKLCNIAHTYESIETPTNVTCCDKDTGDKDTDSNRPNTTIPTQILVSIPQCYNCRPFQVQNKENSYFVLETT